MRNPFVFIPVFVVFVLLTLAVAIKEERAYVSSAEKAGRRFLTGRSRLLCSVLQLFLPF
jgi:hypothetical protein